MTKEMICIHCPIGCALTADTETLTVDGNRCPKGLTYAKEELQNPTRNITTSVRVNGGHMPMLSVKTQRPIPKDKIMDVVAALYTVTVEAPISMGDIIASNIADTGVDIIATRSVLAVSSHFANR